MNRVHLHVRKDREIFQNTLKLPIHYLFTGQYYVIYIPKCWCGFQVQNSLFIVSLGIGRRHFAVPHARLLFPQLALERDRKAKLSKRNRVFFLKKPFTDCYFPLLLTKCETTSMGTGKTIVVFFSWPMVLKVWIFLKKNNKYFLWEMEGEKIIFVFIICIPAGTSAAGLRLSSPAPPPPPSGAYRWVVANKNENKILF